jgi:hypothetical protein
MKVLDVNTHKVEKNRPVKKLKKKISRIKLEFDKDLEVLSGTILFPEKLVAANKFLSKVK